MPDGELNVTLGTLSLSSDAEPSGDIVRAVLANISLSSEGRVLLYGALATTLDSVTSAASGGVEIAGALAATLGGVSAETFGASLNGTTAPYEDILSWTGHPATGSLVRVRTGNLVGIFGEPNEFGLFAGEGWDPSSGAVPLASSQYIRLGSITNEFHNVPINLYDDGDITMQMEPDAPSFAMGNPIPSGYETGAGLWQGKDTDDIYKWRVGDPSVGGSMLSWNGGSLSLVNSSLDISGATAHIAFGDPPPTSPTSGTGIWIDKTGLYGINAGVTQIFIDTLDGILYVDGGTELGVNPLLGNLYIDGLLTLGTDGRMQQGTGTWGTDFTGSAIWNDSGIMNIGGWNNNVKQWWGGSDGKLKAGGGDIVLGENGIILNALSGSDAYDSKKSLNFMMMDTNTLVGYLSGYKGGNEEAYANILRMWANGSSPNYRSTLKFITYNGDASNQKISIITLQSTPTNTSIVFTADSSLAIGNFNVTNGGLHVGGTSDPGTDNLVVDGTIKDGSGVEYSKSTHNHTGTYLPIGAQAADSDKLDGLHSSSFVQMTGNQTVAGIKTFSSIPVLPASDPTTANQAVRKSYADALVPSATTLYTATLVGWSGTPDQAMKYVRIGKLMILTIYISGTSNTTTATATLPSGITAMALGYTQYAPMRVVNAGSMPGSWGMAALSSGGSTISFYINQSGGGWTNSGTKTIEGTFVFLTA